MKWNKWLELHASGDDKKPFNTHLWWVISDFLWYMVDSSNQKVLLKSVDKGVNWTIVHTRSENIARGFRDGTNIWLVDCDYDGTESKIWVLYTANDYASERFAFNADVYDIFRYNNETYIIYTEIQYTTATTEEYPDDDVGGAGSGDHWTRSTGLSTRASHIDELKGATPDGEYLNAISGTFTHDKVSISDANLGGGKIIKMDVKVYAKVTSAGDGILKIAYDRQAGVYSSYKEMSSPIIVDSTSFVWYNWIREIFPSDEDIENGANWWIHYYGEDGAGFNLHLEDLYVEFTYTTGTTTNIDLKIANLDHRIVYDNFMGDGSGRTYDISYTVKVGNYIYFLWKWSNENVKLWKWEIGTENFTEIKDCGSNTDLADVLNQHGIAYNGVNHISFVLKDTSDSKIYFYTYGISDDDLEKGGECNVAIMMDRNTGSDYREKAFHITDYEIYELTNNKTNLLMIDSLALNSAVVGISDLYLITGGESPKIWEYINREKQLIDSCNIAYKRGNPTSCNFISYDELVDNEAVIFYDDNDVHIFEGSIIEKEYDELNKWTYKCMGFDVELVENKLTISASAENAATLIKRVLDQCNYLTYTSTSITDPSIDITMEFKNLNVRTILKTIADKCDYLFYVTPTGIVYFNDGTTDSGKTVTQSSGIFGKPKVKDIAIQINFIKGFGSYDDTGKRISKVAEDKQSQQKYGKNRYIDHFPHVDDETELQALVDAILARKGIADNPKYLYVKLYGLDLVLCGNTLNLTFASLNLTAADYYIIEQKYAPTKNEGTFVISTGLVTNWRGYGYAYGKTTEADEEQLDQLAKTVFDAIDGIGDVGEANTGSKVGTDGIGVYDGKVNIDLQFRNIAPKSGKITVELNDNDIDIDVGDIDSVIEGIITTELEAGQSIDNRIDTLIAATYTDAEINALITDFIDAAGAVAAIEADDTIYTKAEVDAFKLNKWVVPDGTISMNAQKIVNLANGIFGTDAMAFGQKYTNANAVAAIEADDTIYTKTEIDTNTYTRAQVDTAVATKDTKEEAHAYVEATALTMTEDITFNAGQTFDGEDVSALAADLTNQATAAEAIDAVEAADLTLTQGTLDMFPATGTAAVFRLESSEDAYIEVEGDEDNDDEAKHAWISFFQDGRARFLHIGVGKEDNDNEGFITVFEKLLFNTGALESGTKRLEINTTGIDVVGSITVSGNVDGVDIAGLKTAFDALDYLTAAEVAAAIAATYTDAEINNLISGFIDAAGAVAAIEADNTIYTKNEVDGLIHTRLHAITDVLDHSANNHKIFYSDGSNHIIELALGAEGKVLKAHGNAAPTWENDETGEVGTGRSTTGIFQVPLSINNGATWNSGCVVLDAVGEDCYVSFTIQGDIDPSEDIVMKVTHLRADAGGGGIQMKLYVAATKTDGSEGLVWNIESATDFTLVGATNARYYIHSYTIANAGIAADDAIRILLRHNEAGRDVEIMNIMFEYTKLDA